MICIKSINTNPYFNLAAEEYLLKNTNNEIFMTWKNDPTVITGKHQNSYAEIDYWYTKKNNIKIARRLSGGGAVYHDQGNLNFTFILNKESGKQINFKESTKPVILFLQSLSLNAEHRGKNDIVINNRKISGNAEHVYKNRVLHHGTLLFSSEVDKLQKSLHVVEEKYTGKAVQSNRSDVINISACFNKKLNIHEFEDKLIRFIANNHNFDMYEFTKHELDTIEKLSAEKYASWEWIFGYSPDYTFNNSFADDQGVHTITMNVKKGIITDCKIVSETLEENLIRKIEKFIKGKYHKEDVIKNILENILSQEEHFKLNIGNFIYALF